MTHPSMAPTGDRAPKYKTGTTIQRDSHVKVLNTTDDGIVEAIVSVYGNVDSYGDVVVAGAFDEDIAAWAASGDPIPAIWAHEWYDPFHHIGIVLEARSVEKGLQVRMQLDIADNPTAAQVFRLLKGRRVKQFSFAYDILDAGWATRRDEATGKEYEVYELRKLHVIEVGPCLVGANRETELLTAKTEQLTEAAKSGTLTTEQATQLERIKSLVAELDETTSAPAEATEDGQQTADAADPDEATQPDVESASDEEKPASRPLAQLAQSVIDQLEENPS